MRRVVVVMLLSGCSSVLGIEDFKLGDAGTTGGEMMEQGYCLGPTGWRVCVDSMPTTPRMVDSTLTFDTTSSPLCANAQTAMWMSPGQPDACFIVGSSVTFSAPMIRAIGARPLVVFASDEIRISSQLDVASHTVQGMVSRGPGSPSSACVAPVAPSDGNAGAGGAGGSFTTKGGDGGNASTAGSMGGRAAAADAAGPTLLRAGCGGGKGGNGGQLGGPAGAGGGAVYLVAGNRITIEGFINASGAAGVGGAQLAGGGGGGSGGMIHLNAPMIGGNGGVLVANGGGGGEGGDPNQPGTAGSDPVPNMPQMTPLGGNGNSIGGNGGNGFVFNPPNVTMATAGGVGSPTAAAAGGGGGGGGGFIRANMMPSQVVSSPAITVIQAP